MKRIGLILWLFIVLGCLKAYSRSTVFPDGSKPAGMGNAFVSQYHLFSVFQNQAGLAALDKTSVAIFYENRYLVPQMSIRAGVITLPTSGGNFAFQINSFGPPQWAESNIGIAYSRYLSERLSAGVQLNYFGTKLPELNSTAMSVGFETGAIYRINDKTFLGIHIANPFSPAINTTMYRDKIPWRFKLGGHTQFTDDFVFSYEIEKMESLSPLLKMGAEWEPSEGFFVRGGLTTPYNTSMQMKLYAGFGIETNFFTFDTSFSYHNFLGYVPSVSLIFSFF